MGDQKPASEALLRRRMGSPLAQVKKSGKAQDKSAIAHPSSGSRTKKGISRAQICRRQPGCFSSQGELITPCWACSYFGFSVRHAVSDTSKRNAQTQSRGIKCPAHLGITSRIRQRNDNERCLCVILTDRWKRHNYLLPAHFGESYCDTDNIFPPVNPHSRFPASADLVPLPYLS